MNRWMIAEWTDGKIMLCTHGNIMLLSHTLTMRGNDAASLVGPPSGIGGDSVTKDGRTTDAQKNSVALTHPHHEGK